MCGLKEIFEGAGNFFDKKVPANPTFPFGKIKFNPFRFAQTFSKVCRVWTESTVFISPIKL